MVTVTWQTNRWNAQINALYDALIGSGQMGDAARMIVNEFRSFLRRQIALTPPKTKKQGEEAIERDQNKIFTPVNEEFLNSIGSQFGISGIDTWITSATTNQPVHIQWDKIDPTGSGMDAFHRANLNARGRTRNLKKSRGESWYSPYVVSFGDFANFLAKLQSHVGRRRAAWAVSFQSVGGTVASWISRHLGEAKGEVIDNLQVQNHPSITAINRAPGIADDERIFRDNIRISSNAIAKKIRLIIAGYSYDMASGRLIRPQEMKEAA